MYEIMTLKPHQEVALEKIKNGSVLAGGVGVGKSFTALAYFVLKACGGSLTRDFSPSNPLELIVITTAKKRNSLEWEKDALPLGIFPDAEESYTGKPFVVDSWNNLHKYLEKENCFFIFDEQMAAGTGHWSKRFVEITKRNQWIMLSATPADVWIDYVPLFIAHGFYRNRTEFIDEHVIWQFNGRYRKIKGYYGRRRLEYLRDQILVDMPYERHTTRHLIAEEVTYDTALFDQVWKRRWNIFTGEPLVDVAEMHRVARELVNSDPSRLNKLEELSAKHPRMVIFYNFDYELEMLRTLSDRLDITVREWNGHKHEDIPTDTDRWLYLVQYLAGDKGWNCVTTDTIVFFSLTYSHKQFEQAQGRIDRMNTPYIDLYYYILMSKSKIDQIIWRCIIAKKNFHEGRNRKFESKKERDEQRHV